MEPTTQLLVTVAWVKTGPAAGADAGGCGLAAT
jgi:hypothetical protein